MEKLVTKEQLSDKELQTLLEARDKKEIDFKLIDVREPFEYEMEHIVGTDELLPTSKFYDWIEKLKDSKETIILYCRTGNRSFQVQQILKQQGKIVGNLTYGIVEFSGKVSKGAFVG